MKNSVGHKHIHCLWPAIPAVSPLSTPKPSDVYGIICHSGCAQSSRLAHIASIVPPACATYLTTISVAPVVLVSVSEKKWEVIAIHLPNPFHLELTWWWNPFHWHTQGSLQGWKGCHWSLLLSAYSHPLDQPAFFKFYFCHNLIGSSAFCNNHSWWYIF